MNRIILIAGHNGAGTGANGFIDEGAETVVLRDLIASELTAYGIKPITDREREKQKLAQIVAWIKSFFKKDDICVDIHFNASSNAAAGGCEVIIPTKNSHIERCLAKELANSVSFLLNIKNRGVKTENQSQYSKLAMLSGFDCTNILIEVCFVSNRNDADRYFASRETLAAKIVNILYKFLHYV